MEIPVSQQAAEQGWSLDRIITSMEVKELARLAEEQGYPHPTYKGSAYAIRRKRGATKSSQHCSARTRSGQRAAGGTALYLVGGTIMTEEEFTGSKVA